MATNTTGERDHYAYIINDNDEIGHIDIDQERGVYVTSDGREFEQLSDAMNAVAHPQSARNRADAKYRKANVTRFEVKLYPADSDIARHLKDIDEPRATYIKRLIREDMARRA
jgi:hypothetical protein